MSKIQILLICSVVLLACVAVEADSRKHHSRRRAMQAGGKVACPKECGKTAANLLPRVGPILNQNSVPNGAEKCWLTVTAMMMNWKNRNRAMTIANAPKLFAAGSPLRGFADAGRAVPPREGRDWIRAMNWTDEQASFGPLQICNMLKDKGPVVVGGLADVRGALANVWGHVRILVGMSGNDCNNEDTTQVDYINPDGGVVRRQTFKQMRQNMEAFHSAYNSALQAQAKQLAQVRGSSVGYSEIEPHMHPLSYAHFD